MLIGLTGPAGGGKDTVADMVMRKFPEFQRRSFAQPLKTMLAVGLGLSQAQLNGDMEDKSRIDPRYGCSARWLMQTLGTEWGRNIIDPDIWLTALKPRIENCSHVIITDVRFANEAAYIRKKGKLVHVWGRGGIDGAHESENPIEYEEKIDYVIDNKENLEYLFIRVGIFTDRMRMNVNPLVDLSKARW